jgi:non-ribosomal peptide synthase protein (TIGR01720 family)
MADSMISKQYRERLKLLSASQRSDLAGRLAAATGCSPGRQRGDRLIACVVPKAGQDVDSDDVREYVRGQLTEYMVPQIIIVQHGLPRTAAGKLDRDALHNIEVTTQQEFEEDEFAQPANDTEATLAEIWAEVLGLDQVSTNDNFFEVGGDSLLSIRILSKANRAGLRISPEKFFAHPTIAEQAIIAEPEGTVAAEQGFVSGHTPMLPIQRWFFENVKTTPQQWNQAPLYAVSAPIERLTLERAIQRLVNHHDALRSRFIMNDGGIVQDFSQPLGELPLDWIELQSVSVDSQKAEILAFAETAHGEFSLDKGPLVRFAYFSTSTTTNDYLLILVHHLIIDAVSWRLLIEDLTTLLDSLESGKPVTLPKKTTALKTWATRLAELANSDAIIEQAEYWAMQQANFEMPLELSQDLRDNTVATTYTVSTKLDPILTGALFDQVPKSFRTRINDALLAALTMTLGKFGSDGTIQFDLEGHGREPLFDDVDLSRTIGWLTTVYPVVLKANCDDTVSNLLTTIKDQLRIIPSNGISHGLLRYVAGNTKLMRVPKSQVLFNFLGRIDRISGDSDRLRLLESNIGQARGTDGQRIYVIEIDSRVQDGCLTVDWTASSRLHSRQTIEDLAEHYRRSIEKIVLAASSGETANSPSDFPLADLDADEMDNLAEMLEGIDDAS